ncbi:hypothetical protein GCM10010112_84900 [Actinoplanes lobatus]|uniref:DUF3396 domain-containing protein n=1 Tax=Actinoplanes lobatus TaxID=113568 RepID=A0A7W7HKW2_9ACTN|nr:hypothetical protein [Actinoplanes lobatus]MBB4752399.1 hypothetical protein [Actinoplanes lobatus]GGN95035.1 hypothetical protein GCM10010112_84900 [Actinoplanes lobatus]GIE46107.1 hypothetical protein Alo02nite_90050 [Actinoplanes lobatus]
MLWVEVYLDQVDMAVGQAWHGLAAEALTPMLQPAGAPAFRRRYSGFRDPDGDGSMHSVRARSWAGVLLPTMSQAHGSWGYGDDPSHGPLDLVQLGAFRESSAAPFMHLEIRAGLADPAAMPELADALIGVVRQIGERADVAYGEMCSHPLRRPWTTLDRALRRRDRESLPQSRQVLRGYEWVTMCPAELAKSLGEAKGLRDTGAFAEVVELATGGLLLRATRSPLEYDDAAVQRVFEAVRPVLPPGRPRHLEVETLRHVVMADASA